MFTGHRLAVALGGLDARTVTGDDEQTRKQLVRAGEAMVDAGLAIVLNKAGTKQPLCHLTAVEAKRADQAARDQAAEAGDPDFHKRRHDCGLSHVITDRRDVTRILGRIVKRERFNIGVHCGRSRVLIVDLDTFVQVKKFQLRCGEQRPGLTVRSPGSRNADGDWAHKDGGHIWFDIPDDVELPTNTGIYKDPDAGWVAMWGEHQVLVPPSIRAEGPYVLEGSTHPLPDWLREVITAASAEQERRRERSRVRREERRSRGEGAEIDEWAARTPWSEILEPDGWVDTGLIDNCGCPIWTAPGVHGSPKSATAHESGCDTYSCEVGHGPLHVWTDNPSDAVAAAINAYGTRTLTKLHVTTWTQGAGNMARTCEELGIERPGPTTIRSPLATWDEAADTERTRSEPPTTNSPNIAVDDDDDADDRDTDDGPASIDEINEHSPRKVDELSYDERMIRKEYERIHWYEEARKRYEATHVRPLRKWGATEFLGAPRPEPLVPGMLYRDSLARVYGAPGGGKSFVAIDIALSLATGRFWNGTTLPQERVIYIMAEGQRVNGDRTEAWLSKNHRSVEDIEDWFFVVPDAIALTQAGVAELVEWVRELRPGLVVLDTKNAMMIGDENTSKDNGEMRRILDLVRTAVDACVLLIDHTGHEGTRPRGSTAGTAMMDSEVRVTKDDNEKPSIVMAEVTRDKAGETGEAWAWRLISEHPAAVLEPAQQVLQVADEVENWLRSNQALPEPVENYEGPGSKAVTDLARLMIFQTIPRHDRSQLGLTLTEARRELKVRLDHDPMTVKRAWSALKDMGYLASVYEEPTAVQERTGPHVWIGPSGLNPGPAIGGEK